MHQTGRARWTKVTFPATELGVRRTLAVLRSALEHSRADLDDAGAIEIAVAEALNNIVEHGGCASGPARITARWRIARHSIDVELADTGIPLPQTRLPCGRPPDLNRSAEDLPEGGFGWFLIRTLCHRLSYHRIGVENRLSLGFDLGRLSQVAQNGLAPKAPH